MYIRKIGPIAVNPFDEKTQKIVSQTAQVLEELGVTSYLVGGSVRDAILGKTTRDVDIVVSGSANEVVEALAESLNGHIIRLPLEFDAARVIVKSGDHIVTLDLLSLKKGGIDPDLRRRDFTMNAIATPLESTVDGSWKLIDPLGGKLDIASRTVRAASDSVFSDDPVRMLRAVRLAAETGFAIEPRTESLIRRDAPRLTGSSAERIREVLLRTLAARGAANWIRLMDSLGLLSTLIPELDRARNVEQPREHYYDVFGHLVAALDYADQIVSNRYEYDFVREMMPTFDRMEAYFGQDASDGHTRGTFLKLTALLHDIAKPQTKTIEPSGRVRFFGHSEKGEELAEDILTRLRVGRRGVSMVRSMVRHHLRPRQMGNKGELPTNRAIHRYYRDLGDVALDTLYLNMADFLAARGPLITSAEMCNQVRVINHILTVGPQNQTVVASRKGLLTGHDIMKELQIESGPLVGRLLKSIAEAEARDRIKTREEALKLARANFKTGVAGG
ncbi:MAG: HD domain-containing protein [Dehalococcoidia bacterium]|nr:HD domain-containing protein [Dehalococcoidia bacterium]